MVKDMTSGNPIWLILIFSIPLLIGNLFQQFYSMADTIIVGHTIGVQALAAVGSTGAISFLIIGFVQGLTGGFAVVTAQMFGAGNYDEMRHSVGVSVLLCLIFTVGLTTLSVLGTRWLLEFMNTPADIIEDAYIYIVIIFGGIGASFFYNMLSGILRSLGDSKTPLYFLVLASLLNVGLDFLFIISFHMGVAGAAWATVLAQFVSGLLCLIYMAKKFPILHLHRQDFKMDSYTVLLHLRVGLPMALQFSITAIGVMVLQTALNGFGSTIVAAYTAASKVEQLTSQPLNTLGITIATYAAQNLGAGRYDRIRDGVRKCTLISIASALVSGACMVLFGRFFVSLFISGQAPGVIDSARLYLNTISVFFVVLGLLFVYRNTLQGMGSSMVPMLGGALELVMRVVVCLTLPTWLGYFGVCLASPAAWIGATIPLLIAYHKLIHRFCD